MNVFKCKEGTIYLGVNINLSLYLNSEIESKRNRHRELISEKVVVSSNKVSNRKKRHSLSGSDLGTTRHCL